jgi:adenylosuccinate lyase
MSLSPLNAISPIDGRYRNKVSELSPYFSEYGLIKYRLFIEIEYFIALCKLPLPQLENVPSEFHDLLRKVYEKFDETEAQKIKEIEKITNHDVKSVEYYLKEKFDEAGFSKHKEFIHFALTSQDINNTAIPMSLKIANEKVYLPALEELRSLINSMSKKWLEIPMLSRTHGQPASPTTVGKELAVFVERIKNQMELLSDLGFSVKFGGAIGNFNAHSVAYPQIDWKKFSDNFVEKTLGMKRQQNTTQIEHYDLLAAFFDNIKRINNILIDLCRDVWSYISIEYFKQKINPGEVGSSTMPHKVNPIDFENAEGNLGIANALFEHLSAKLPISRLQRDLTDSTVTRNIGVPMAHSLLSIKSLSKGLGKLLINESRLQIDLDLNWAVVAEAIQTILRREGYDNPYEALKELTRNNVVVSQSLLSDFIDQLEVESSIKEELKKITPHNYTGIYS